MNMPGFTAEASVSKAGDRHLTVAVNRPNSPSVIAQFCYCECRLYRTCIPIPPLGVPICFYREVCIPHGTCPPGYCR